MKKLSIFILLLVSVSSYSQLPNSNMSLLANKNDHFTSTLYSAVWGYTADDGREYAILGCPNGTAFYDITDTTNIVEVDFLPGLTSSWREMKTFGKFAYIVSEAGGSGLQIVNLKYMPDSVSLVGTFTFSGYTRTHTISQSGPYLYMNGGDYQNGGIFVLDLTQDPRVPVKRGEWEVEYIHDCRVVNDTIWGAGIFDGNIYVIDATNKDNLVSVTNWLNVPQPGPHNTALTTDRRFLFVTDEIGGSPRLLKIWNVENVMNPVQAATWQPTGITTSIVHNVEINGNLAVVAHYSAGVRLLDITNPTAPVEIAWYDTYPANNSSNFNGCWGVYMFPSGKIIASDRQTGLYVLNPSSVLVNNNNNNQNLPKSFALKQNYPNPFNPSTKIEYSLPKNIYVTLKVYNVLGKEVATLVDKFETAGNHKVSYDASNLPSGAYFYQIKTNDFSQTKKMTLVK
ncbi:MAG: choice-of-anchor B family protein [Chlorobi bacterium]|nr:choice-of-anchor B family protein [Chlorobiota bacterium]MCI0715843.1 choice-of-anchor B family protein [Chlorobiota bacterium]